MAMKEHIQYKADTTPLRSTSSTQNISLCFLIPISAVILKLMLKITSIFPRDLGESLRREEEEEEEEEVHLFTIHSFIHITYYIITRQEIKQASKLKKSKSKCSFSRQVKRLDESKALESY